jgi:hypothetical protein
MYKCENCNKIFEFNSLFLRHKSKKLGCKEKIIDYNEKIKDIDDKILLTTKNSLETKTICLFCNCEYKTKSNLTRHINKSCTEKNKLLDNQKQLILEKDKNENKQLKEMLIKLLEKQSQPIQPIQPQNITNNITNNINQTNNVIMINSFGNEDLSHITLQDYKQYLNSYFKGFIKYIEKVHFDDNMPENHNICITNLKSKDIKVYEGDKWVAKQKTDIIDKFLRKKLNTLIDKCEELEEHEDISEKVVDNFSEFQVNYMDDSAKKNTKDDVILMMYNNKDKVKVK